MKPSQRRSAAPKRRRTARFTPFWRGARTIISPPPALPFPSPQSLPPVVTALALEYSWAQVSAQDFALAMAAAYFCALGVLWFLPNARLWLVSRRTQYERAHQNAQAQFLSRNIHVTKRRTGVLIFVSLAERFAEVVADEAIDLRVQQEEWDGIVAILIDHAKRGKLAEGYLLAIEKSGALLKEHFPKSHKDVNELDDHMVEL